MDEEQLQAEQDAMDDIDQLDTELVSYDSDILQALVTINSQLLEAIRDLLDRLELKGPATTAEQMKGNFRQLVFWQADLSGLLTRYVSGWIDQITAKMLASQVRINRYYGILEPGFIGTEYNELVNGLMAQTKQLLTDTVVGQYSAVLSEVLNYGVLTKATAADLRKIIQARLPIDGGPVRAVSQVASDALHTFSRGYTQAVAEGLKLKHFYYMGTEIATTRSFCRDRYNRAFTQAEVESWAKLEWSGKIPGTTTQTIFWYVGGFRCRHRLLPISVNLFLYFKQQSK